MKKALKIIGIVFVILIIASAILGTIADKHDGPRQSFLLVNTSETTKSVTFDLINENDTAKEGRYLNETVLANESVIKRIPEGKYTISVWDEDDYLYDETEFEFKLKNSEESDYSLYRFDLAMDKNFFVLNLNALYSGNDFAEHMSNAVGTNNSQIEITKSYKSNIPFLIPDQYTGKTFIDLNEDLPTNIKYGESVYGLFFVSDTLNDSETSQLLYQKAINKN